MSLNEVEAVFFIREIGDAVVVVSWCAALVCVVGVVDVGVELFAAHEQVVGVVMVGGVWFAALVGDVVGSVLEGQFVIGVEVIMIVGEADAVSALLLSHCYCCRKRSS